MFICHIICTVEGLPSLFLSQKFGNKILQLIGGVVLSGAIALTAITTKSWQGLLLSGVSAGSSINKILLFPQQILYYATPK